MQLDYSEKPALGVEGMIADSTDSTVETRFVQDSDGITPGLLVVRGSAADDAAIKPPTPTAADDEAIITATALSAAPSLFTGAGLNGVVGGSELTPARQLQLTLTSDPGFMPGPATVVGLSERGERDTESIGIPPGGPAVVGPTKFFSRLLSFSMPAATPGAGGSWRLGVGAAWAFKVGDIQGVAMFDATKAPGPYKEMAPFPVVRRGHVWVVVENAVQFGDKAFVRATVNVTGQRRGAFRSDDDSGRASAIPARFVTSAGVGGLAKLELDLYAA